MNISEVIVFGFEAAFRGMRHSRNSHDKADSEFVFGESGMYHACEHVADFAFIPENPVLGPNDLSTAKRLCALGTEHRKFLRMIHIWADLELPRYLWVDLDTYKVGTTRNSESTRHKPKMRDLMPSDFEDENVPEDTLTKLNIERWAWTDKANSAKTRKESMRRFKQLLPESFLQTATYNLNYEVALSILRQRQGHPLPEFRTLCEWLLSLPYMKEFYEASRSRERKMVI